MKVLASLVSKGQLAGSLARNLGQFSSEIEYPSQRFWGPEVHCVTINFLLERVGLYKETC